jgi:predicted secreted protein
MTQGGSSTFFVDKGPLIAFGGAPTSGYTWSLAAGSTLPQGTTFDPTTGMFYQGGSGVAILPGTWTFKMVVSDGSSKATGTFTLVVNVGSSMNPIPKADFQKSLAADIPYPDAKVGMGYGASLWCTGDGALPWKWTIMDGSLPPGLELNQASGIIYGTPLPAAAGNTYHFRISVKDAIGVEAIGDPTYSIIVAK